MTIDKKEEVRIPVWVVTLLLPVLITTITALTIFAAGKATLDEKVKQVEISTKTLDEKKVDRNELNLILKQLDRIEEQLQDKENKKQQQSK